MSSTNREKSFQKLDVDEGEMHNEKDILKHSQPLWLTNKYVNNSCCVVIIMQLFFIMMIGITFIQQYASLSEQTNRDFLIWDNERVIDQDLYFLMQDEFQEKKDKVQVPERSEVNYGWTTSIIFECNECTDNILTGENVQLLYSIEQNIMQISKYTDLCLATYDSTECSEDSLMSITKFIPNPSSATDAEVQSALNQIVGDPQLFEDYKFLFPNDFSASNLQASMFRSVFFFGAPIKVNGSLKLTGEDDQEAQNEVFETFSQDLIEQSRTVEEPSNINIIEYSPVIASLEIEPVASQDFMYIIGSVIFVWCYLTFHLKSTFLASQSMYNIVVSFPITLVLYRGILMVDYFSFLHFMAIFLILGVAADDVFVYIDCWRQSGYIKLIANNYERRMAYTFRRASKAMLATSSTTSACFFATGLSDMMPIASFGIFAGILIPINYILVITYFPAVLMIYEKYFSNLCCKKGKNQKKEIKNDESIDDINQLENKEMIHHEVKQSFIEVFFEGHFNTFVYKARYIIIVIFLIWTGIATWRALLLEPIQEMESFIPDDFEVIRARNLISDEFTQSNQSSEKEAIYIQYYWGALDIDKEGVGKWDNENAGEIIWDDSFDLSPKSNQQWLYDFCQSLKQNELVLDQEVECFILDFKEWVELEKQLSFPVKKSNFLDLLDEFTKTQYGFMYKSKGQIGLMEDTLKFIVIEVAAKGETGKNYEYLNPIYLDWENFKENQQEEAPYGLQNQTQVSLGTWAWMISEKALISSAVNGIFISLIFSFIVLVLTSLNIIVSFYSVICISGIVLSVTAIMQMKGWQMGIAESISIVILIGLSVDYIVHLANHYVESEQYPDRFTKVQVSLKEIGISIISGAFTTVGAGFFLFFAVIILFNKFALLILLTISFSVLYSLLLLCAILHIAGPEGNIGNLKVIFCSNKQEDDIQPLSVEEKKKKINQNVEIRKVEKPDGTKYHGGYKGEKYQGQGELIFPNGCLYSGEFDQGYIDGKGIYIWQDGKVYNGQWKQGIRQGYGVTIWPNKSKFSGQYYLDRKHGYGQYVTEEGHIYEGYWKKGKQNDFCKITLPEKQILYKYFKDGKEITKSQKQRKFQI